jgi:hypothetical protein
MISEQVYNMLSMKQKLQLEDDWNIDCATDLETRIVQGHEDDIEQINQAVKEYIKELENES